MQRIASLVLVCVISVALAGCKNNQKGKAMADKGTTAEDYTPVGYHYDYTPKSSYSPMGEIPQPEPMQPTMADSMSLTATTDRDVPAPAGARYHTVARSDTLYKLARTYYGNPSRWREIYEANRAKIKDPNKIMVGQRLVIP